MENLFRFLWKSHKHLTHNLQQEQQLRMSLAGALVIPCAACGWIHRHGLAHPLPPLCEAARLKRRETTTTERGHVKRARTQHQERRTYEKRRREVSYRFSMFKVQAARRGKTVELQRHEFARILRQQCFYCSSTGRIGVDRVQNDGHYTLANSVPCCASCNYMKGGMRLREFAEHAHRVGQQLGGRSRSRSMP